MTNVLPVSLPFLNKVKLQNFPCIPTDMNMQLMMLLTRKMTQFAIAIQI